MIETPSNTPFTESMKNSIIEKGYIEIAASEFKNIENKVKYEPEFDFIMGRKLVLGTEESEPPFYQEVVVIYDPIKIVAKEFVTSGPVNPKDEDERDLHAHLAMGSLGRGYPVLSYTHRHETGEEENRAVYFQAIEDLELQTA